MPHMSVMAVFHAPLFEGFDDRESPTEANGLMGKDATMTGGNFACASSCSCNASLVRGEPQGPPVRSTDAHGHGDDLLNAGKVRTTGIGPAAYLPDQPGT